MDKIEFKKVFGNIAERNGFLRAFGGWFKESLDCIAVLDLQKSNYGEYYELNIKIFIQGAFGNSYKKTKELVKKDTGDIFTRQPNEYSYLLNLDQKTEDTKRIDGIEKFFKDYLTPMLDKLLTKTGINELASKDQIYLLPAVKEQIVKLLNK